MPGPPLVAFRPDAALLDALYAYAEEIGLPPNAAARTLLEAALGVEKGNTAKNAALRAAVKQAVWRVHAQSRKALQEALDTAKTSLEQSFDLDAE